MSGSGSPSASPSPNEPHEGSPLLRDRPIDPPLDSEQAPEPVPEVNPLNQHFARIYRVFLVALVALSLFWLALLSVDLLISVGVSASQGSGFEVFSTTLLGLASVSVSVLFYKAPSASDRVLNLVCTALLIIDMLLIVLVEQLRRRIGIVPMAISFGGALIGSIAGGISDTVVQRAKEQELRRTGNSEFMNRRSAVEWIQVVLSSPLRILIFVLFALLSINLIFDAADSHTAVGDLIPIGKMPDGANDGTYIHIACSPAGTDGPVAIIEAGETSGEDMHGWVQRVQGLKAVCFWDRPGIGLSDNAPSPLGMEAVVSYLQAALEVARPESKDEKLLLISHGVGSLYSRVFANKLSDRVAGLVLIDALHEQKFYEDQTVLHGLREFVRGVTASFSTSKILGVIRGLGAEERLFGLLTKTQPRLHKALLQQQVSANRRTALDISLATDSLPKDTPVLVISSSEMCENKQWNRYQRLLLRLTDRVVAWKILEGPHNLWWNKRAEKDLISQVESFVSYVS